MLSTYIVVENGLTSSEFLSINIRPVARMYLFIKIHLNKCNFLSTPISSLRRDKKLMQMLVGEKDFSHLLLKP
jgi:hypothetical protein